MTLENIAPHKTNNFDFLRLFAAIAVLFSHSYMLLAETNSEPLVRLINWPFSEMGVNIFFIISGYLITMSYCNNPKTYWRSRFLRIAPALTVNILITVFIIGAIFTTLSTNDYFHDIDTYKYLVNILTLPFDHYLPGVFRNQDSILVNGSLWTLGKEVMMYILIWLIGRNGLDFKKAIPALALIFVILILANILYFATARNHIQLTLIPNTKLSLLFLIGSAFYIYRDKIIFSWQILAIIFLTGYALNRLGANEILIYTLLPYATFYFAFHKRIRLHNSARFGDFSYGIYIYAYLIQQCIIQLTNKNIDPLTLLAYTLPLSLILAFLSWHLIEKPALSLKK